MKTIKEELAALVANGTDTVENVARLLGVEDAETIKSAKEAAARLGLGKLAPRAWACPGDGKWCGFMSNMHEDVCSECGRHASPAEKLGVVAKAST